ncbi:MAG TPA: hypothetical protein HPP76_10120, partial [Desulfuromonadales bacterium]|nr:hypothetical protein [Desulfuromonadales bacterium]
MTCKNIIIAASLALSVAAAAFAEPAKAPAAGAAPASSAPAAAAPAAAPAPAGAPAATAPAAPGGAPAVAAPGAAPAAPAAAPAPAAPAKKKELKANKAITLSMFAVIIGITLSVVVWAAKRTKTAADFYAAGGGITGTQNGWAIAGDYMSA